MLATLIYGPYDAQIKEIPEPRPVRGWVKIKVEEVGICGTDKAIFKGDYKLRKYPIVPGHEIVGVIEEVGDGVHDKFLRKRVVTEINISCGNCWFCRHNLRTHCINRRVLGISINGGMAEYVITPLENIHIVENLEPPVAAFVEPLAAVLRMMKIRPPISNSNIAVLGIGTIGLLSIQVLKYTAPKRLIAISRPKSPKAELAETLGADQVLTFEEAINFSRNLEASGFDYVIEATGSKEGLNMALKLVRPLGIIIVKSTHGLPAGFDLTSAVVKEVEIIGSRCGPFYEAIKMLKRGLVNVEKLITAVLPLRKADYALRLSLNRDQVKVHVVP